MIRYLALRFWCAIQHHPTTNQEVDFQNVHWCACGRVFDFKPVSHQ